MTFTCFDFSEDFRCRLISDECAFSWISSGSILRFTIQTTSNASDDLCLHLFRNWSGFYMNLLRNWFLSGSDFIWLFTSNSGPDASEPSEVNIARMVLVHLLSSDLDSFLARWTTYESIGDKRFILLIIDLLYYAWWMMNAIDCDDGDCSQSPHYFKLNFIHYKYRWCWWMGSTGWSIMMNLID